MRSSEAGLSTSREKVTAALLIVAFFGLVAGYLWWGRFEYDKTLLLGLTYTGAIALILFSHLYFNDSRRELGLRKDNFFQSLKAAATPNLLLMASALIWGLTTQGLRLSWDSAVLLYFPWALLQQYVLQNFLLARAVNILGRTNRAVIVASVAFALIHLPNPSLVIVSLVGALVWCRIFLRVPNLFVVSLSHALLGILLVIFFKSSGFDQLRVGKPGYAYRTYGDGVLVAAGYDETGRPMVVTLPGHDRGNPSRVRVFDPAGVLHSEWIAFPECDFSGNLAVGDVGFGPGDEIVVSPGPGVRNPPEIRVYDLSGAELSRFCLEQSKGYGAAVSVSDGNILVSPGPGPERTAQVFEFLSDGTLIGKWDFGNIGYHNGVRALRMHVEGEGNRAGKPRLLLWANMLSVNGSEIKAYDESSGVFSTWESYGTSFGLNLSLIRLGKDRVGFLTGPGAAPGHGPRIKVFDDKGQELQNLFGYDGRDPCGINVSALDVDGDSRDEIVLGEGICPDQPPIVRIIDRSGKMLAKWKAY